MIIFNIIFLLIFGRIDFRPIYIYIRNLTIILLEIIINTKTGFTEIHKTTKMI